MNDTTRDLQGLPALSVAIRHHLVAIILSVGLAVGLAGLYVTNLSLTYTSSAVVLLSPAPGNPLRFPLTLIQTPKLPLHEPDLTILAYVGLYAGISLRSARCANDDNY